MRSFDPEVAWAAGFFEGEGSITASGGRLTVRIHNTDTEPLERFASIVVFGEVYGPYERNDRDGYKRKPFWAWVAQEYDALEVLELLWPWLSARRHGQALNLAPLEAILISAADT